MTRPITATTASTAARSATRCTNTFENRDGCSDFAASDAAIMGRPGCASSVTVTECWSERLVEINDSSADSSVLPQPEVSRNDGRRIASSAAATRMTVVFTGIAATSAVVCGAEAAVCGVGRSAGLEADGGGEVDALCCCCGRAFGRSAPRYQHCRWFVRSTR